MKTNLLCASLLSFAFSLTAYAKVVRYSDLAEAEMKAFLDGKSEDICEFRKGDILKVKIDVSGEILQAESNPPTNVEVKKGFFLKKADQVLLMSWDGEEFKSFKEHITGQLSVGASGNGSVDAVTIKLEANVRE
jgi:hypothetical protein